MAHDDEQEGAEEWLDEHGNPDYSYLKELAAGGVESIEELRAIAEEHDVDYDTNDSPQDLVDKIIMVMGEEAGHEAI